MAHFLKVFLLCVLLGLGLASVLSRCEQAGAATLLPNGMQQFTDASGQPLANGLVYFFSPGTTTNKDTWSDAAETTLNSNPVTLDSAGRATIYGTGAYREQAFDSGGALIWDKVTQDIYGLVNVVWGGTSGGSANVQTLSPAIPADTASLSVGYRIAFLAGLTNTGAATLNVSSSGDFSVFRPTLAGAIQTWGGEIVLGNIYEAVYLGSGWQLMMPTQGVEPTLAVSATSRAGTSGDSGRFLYFTTENPTAATLQRAGSSTSTLAGWWVDYANASLHNVTLTPNTSTINGAAALTLFPNQATRIFSDGTNYQTMGLPLPWVAPGTAGNVLQSDGTKWVSGNTGRLLAGTPVTLNPFASNISTSAGHGLGVAPGAIACEMVNLTTELGYSPGDSVYLQSGSNRSSGGVDQWLTFIGDAASTTITIGNGATSYTLTNKTTGTPAAIQPKNWKLTCTPYKAG